MDQDLSAFLDSWPFNPEEPVENYRKIEAEDGRILLQVREPLGVQQMEYTGRPDGRRPHGETTFLDYYEQQASATTPFQMDHDDCLILMQEGVLFYQRYLILYQMEDWEGVARDTTRNLRYFNFIRRHAENPEDSLTIEQYRPYVMRMNTIARAQMLWKDGATSETIDLLSSTRDDIKALEPIESTVFKMEREKSVRHLGELIEEFKKRKPESRLDQLRREKRHAVLSEDFELAARLRDEIRMLEGSFASQN